MKTLLLALAIASLGLACSPANNETAFGCPDAPPSEGSACDTTTFPPSDICYAPAAYHCGADGKWTYASDDAGSSD